VNSVGPEQACPWAFSIYFVLFTLPAFVMGRMCDKYGIRKVTAFGAILTGIGLTLCSQISSLVQLYLCFGIIGLGISTVFVPSTSTVSRWFVKKRGIAVGIAVTASGFGMFIFSPLTEISVTNLGWRSTFLIYGFFTLVTLFISSLLFKQDPSEVGLLPYGCDGTTSSKNLKENENSATDVMRRRSFWYLYLIILLAHVSYFMFSVHIVPHAIRLGISSIAAATALTIAGIFNMPAKIAAGLIFDKFKSTNLLAFFLAIQTISAFILVISNNVWLIYLASAIMGAGYGSWTVVYTITLSELYGTKNLGLIFGIQDSGVGIGGIIGPYLAGYIFDINGSYHPAFLFGAVMMTLTVFFAIMLHKKK